MKCWGFLLVLLPAAAESPVGKVVTMLKAMSEKGKAELQDEKVQYAKYAQWCESTKAEKSAAVDEASGKMEVLQADMSKAQTDADVLAKDIEEHSAQISKLGAEEAKAKEVRQKEAEDYAVELKDYTESVDAIGRALDTLQKQAGSHPQALVQLKAAGRHAQEVQKLVAMATPKVAAYDFQSGNITGMLKTLQDQFTMEKRELEKAETSKVHSYQLLLASLTSQQDSETEDKERKVGLKAKKLQLKASKQDELTTTGSSKEADTKYLDDVSATCRQKAADYESNQKLRSDELEAISKAVQIVSQKLSLLEVKFSSWLQVKRQSATSLALLRSRSPGSEELKAKVLGFLQGEAQRLKSAALTNLLEPVATAALGKVRETIEGVIERLEEQDNQDTEKQTWCASELKSNEKNRRSKTVLVDELNADIDRLNASIISLGQDIVTMQKDLSDSTEAMTNASQIRQQEKSMNAATIEEAQKAQAAVLEAITALKEFYESSGLALLQEKSESKQPAMTGAYGGMTSETGGVVSLLETISADFARLEADTKSEEQSAAEEFDKLSSDYKVNKAEKETDLKHLQSTKVEKTSQLASKGAELDSGEQELAAALQYYEELKPPCVKGGAAWKEREEQRQEELESLKKAMDIMSSASA